MSHPDGWIVGRGTVRHRMAARRCGATRPRDVRRAARGRADARPGEEARRPGRLGRRAPRRVSQPGCRTELRAARPRGVSRGRSGRSGLTPRGRRVVAAARARSGARGDHRATSRSGRDRRRRRPLHERSRTGRRRSRRSDTSDVSSADVGRPRRGDAASRRAGDERCRIAGPCQLSMALADRHAMAAAGLDGLRSTDGPGRRLGWRQRRRSDGPHDPTIDEIAKTLNGLIRYLKD